MVWLSRIGFAGWAGIAAVAAVAGALALGSVYQARQGGGTGAPERDVAIPGAPDTGRDPAPALGADPSADPGAASDTPSDTADNRAAPAVPPASELAPVPAVAPPAFDVVRIAPDGGALVAGSGVPGSGITLRVDGAIAAQAAADGAGQFVTLFALPPAAQVQIMTLEMVLADGRVITAPDSIVLAPRPSPEAPGLETAAPSLPALAALDAPTAAGQQPRGPAAEPASHADPAVRPGSAEPLEPGALSLMADAAPAPAEPDLPGVTAGGAAPDPATAGPVAGPAGLSETGMQTAAPPSMPAAGTPAPYLAETRAPDYPATEAAVDDVAADDVAAGDAVDRFSVPVPGDDLPTAFMLRESGEVALLDRAPQVHDNVVIDMIGYSDFGDVQISGRAARDDPDAVLRLYLDNRPIALARALDGDWRLDLPQIDPGVYTLRVDQLGAQGQVVSRFETPFQRETPERVARARAEAGMLTTARVPAPSEGEDGGAPLGVDGTPGALMPETVAAADDPAAAGQSASPAPASPAPASSGAETPGSEPPPRPGVALVTVQPGQSLWRISDSHYGDGVRWVQIFRANRGQIRNPDLIYPGQVFTLPD